MKTTTQFILASVLCWIASGCYASERVALSYAGQELSIPAGAKAIGVNNEALILRYGEEKGKSYLGFTRMDADPQYECSTAAFVEAVFTAEAESTCSMQQVENFTRVFAQGKDFGRWEKAGKVVYYSNLEKATFLFMVVSDSDVVQIESDFLNGDEMRKVVPALNQSDSTED